MSLKTEREEVADSTRREEAAFLLAEDRLPDEVIATKVGVSRRQIVRWKKQAHFAARVSALRVELKAHVFEVGIADKAVRLRDYHDLRALLWATIQARAESAQGRKSGDTFGRELAPGAEYGLMVNRPAPGTKGLFEEWEVDAGVIDRLMALDKQAAVEMGQWTERRDVTSDGKSFVDLARELVDSGEL